ncbi:hypothetical protein GALMADRAFT_63499 [Galerina marginata CBS 339.88]|uniref:CHAT domain-containing protein n=1 Tax=Galerina marginata (strain CBS 339.88) TaxID=685588 RepID=A0A067T8Y8_GALM3|nr:hypothetical protein GALMADRAFT_63499 [Galerina marginata CBS 339.88]
MRLSNLGISLRLRFDRSRVLADLSQAINFGQKAIQLAPQGHEDMPIWLGNLGFSLFRRWERVGDLIDLSEAITYQKKAIHLAHDGHADMPTWLNNLGLALQDRFEEVGDDADLAEALTYHQKAIRLTPDDHPNKPIYLSTLGNLLARRSEHGDDLTTDLSDAITYHRKAIHLTPEGHASMPILLGNLAFSHELRFERVGDLTDLSEAITHQVNVLHLSTEGYPDMPAKLYHLACSLQCRFEHSGDPADNQSATSHFWKAATYSTGSAYRRLLAAEAWIEYSRDALPEQLLQAYEMVITFISKIAGLEQTIQKRHSNLLEISITTSHAASAAFQLDRHDLALEWLEQGRCLVWSQLNNLRAPIDVVRGRNPALADNILRVSRALETAAYREELSATTPERSTLQKISREDEVMIHLKLAQQWDELLSTIRAIPEFEDFLRPLSYDGLLKNLPNPGTVVVINVDHDHCDALALTSSGRGARHIPLPNFSYSKAEDLRNQLVTHLCFSGVRMRESHSDGRGMRLETKGEDRKVVTHVLKELWTLVVKPILDRLGYNKPPSELPRIWWCTTGPLAFLPIHAAGIYDSPTAKKSTLCDFAISSYTPTVRVLVDRVKSPHAIDDNKMGLFLVSQPNTPKLPSIPGTRKEVRAIVQLLKKENIRTLCLEGEAATVAEGIKNMESHSCIHFACHASQETGEPLKSGFALDNGRLELSAIIKQKLSGAELAFLSACQTSTGDEKLSEEAVHLAAGMLAAGYRSVVATMWSIKDNHAPKVAQDFYENLIGKEGRVLNGENSARALHYATQNLRGSLGDSESSLLAWVPYVHFGM